MAKKNLDELKRDNPSENNWEIPEQKPEQEKVPVSICQKTFDYFGKHFVDQGKYMLNLLGSFLQKYVPEEIWKDNPIQHFAVCDDHITYIFRDGRKYKVNL